MVKIKKNFEYYFEILVSLRDFYLSIVGFIIYQLFAYYIA